MQIKRFNTVIGAIQAEVDNRQINYTLFSFLAPLVLVGVELAISLGLYLRPHGMGLLYAIPIVAIAAYHYTRLVPVRNALNKAKAALAELEEEGAEE